MSKNTWLTIVIIVVVVAFGVYLSSRGGNPPDGTLTKEVAQCIGENSVLYVQLGCTHCEEQKEMFGENYKYIETIDCFYNKTLCADEQISGTPTWVRNGEQYVGVQSIEKLREITGC